MAVIKYDSNNKYFYAITKYEERFLFKVLKFFWDHEKKVWKTNSWRAIHFIITGDNPDYIDKDSLQNAISLRNTIHVDIETEAMEEYKRRYNYSMDNIKMSTATDSNIEVPAPEGLQYYPFQKAGIEFIAKKKNVLLADEMGLGKTIMVIGYLNYNPKIQKVLIVCPNIVKDVWVSELKRWLVNKNLTVSLKNIEDNIFILNYERLKKYREDILKNKYDLVVFDESHFIKNLRATRTKISLEISANADQVLLLTGTPILNRPVELFTQLYMVKSNIVGYKNNDLLVNLFSQYNIIDYKNDLKNNIMRSYNIFKKTYCLLDEKNRIVDYKKDALNKLGNRLRETCMIRRMKSEVLKELPEKITDVIKASIVDYIEDTNEMNKTKQLLSNSIQHQIQYENIMNSIQQLKDNKDKYTNDYYNDRIKEMRNSYEAIFGEIQKDWHNIGLAKVPFAIKYIKELLTTINKVVVFAHHTDVINQIAEAFPKNSVVITGDTPQEDRFNIINKFNNDPSINIIVISILTGSTGITLTSSSVCVFVEITFRPSDIDQAEARLHRITQKETVISYHLIADDSIDVWIADKIINKREIIKETLEVNTNNINNNIIQI
jgi:SWI/SNF-related matrix-associated actin-dependent regulator 1 of chromatin subfamily A